MAINKKILLGAGALALVLFSRKGQQAKIINIVDDLPKGNGAYSKRSLAGVDKVILHHSAGSFQHDPYDIARWHTDPAPQGRGWAGIGYHFVIMPTGEIYQTNWLDTLSYHTQNQNTVGVSICMIGNFDTQQPTAAALKSLKQTIYFIESKIGKKLPIHQHREYANKSCPGANLYNFQIGKIYDTPAQALRACKDGTYSSATGYGTCKGHGGVLHELDTVTPADLETYFYKDYYIAEMLTKTKFNPQSWRRFGDPNLAKEKFMFLKEGGANIDIEAQSLSNDIGIEVTPQDIVDIILTTDNPYTFIEDMKKEVLEIQRAQLGAIYSKDEIEALRAGVVKCNDGTYSSNIFHDWRKAPSRQMRENKGTCKGHGGVVRHFSEGNQKAAILKQEEQQLKNALAKDWKDYKSKTLFIVPGLEWTIEAKEVQKYNNRPATKRLRKQLAENWKKQANLYKYQP